MSFHDIGWNMEAVCHSAPPRRLFFHQISTRCSVYNWVDRMNSGETETGQNVSTTTKSWTSTAQLADRCSNRWLSPDGFTDECDWWLNENLEWKQCSICLRSWSLNCHLFEDGHNGGGGEILALHTPFEFEYLVESDPIPTAFCATFFSTPDPLGP